MNAASMPSELHTAIRLAKGAGLLITASWAHSGNLMARAHDEEQLRVYEPAAVPAYLAGAIARTTGRRDLPWRYLLDAMEDLAEVWPWTMVEP